MSLVGRFFWRLIAVLFHPVLLISFFGPLVVGLNLRLVQLYDSPLKKLLEDKWVFALIDFHLQFYTLILAYLFFWIEVFARAFWFIQKTPHVPTAIQALRDSAPAMLITTLVVLNLFGGAYALFSGQLASPETIELYLPSDAHRLGEIEIPPLESPITWFRALLVASGVVLGLWEPPIERQGT